MFCTLLCVLRYFSSFAFPPFLICLGHLKLDTGKDGDSDGKDYTHGISISIAVQFKCIIIDIIHNGICAVVRTAACQKLDQRETLEAVDGCDNQNVKSCRHDLRQFDFPEALEFQLHRLLLLLLPDSGLRC